MWTIIPTWENHVAEMKTQLNIDIQDYSLLPHAFAVADTSVFKTVHYVIISKSAGSCSIIGTLTKETMRYQRCEVFPSQKRGCQRPIGSLHLVLPH